MSANDPIADVRAKGPLCAPLSVVEDLTPTVRKQTLKELSLDGRNVGQPGRKGLPNTCCAGPRQLYRDLGMKDYAVLA